MDVSARRIELSDEELACAYSGAEALIYPSFYEGFGVPVIEAMACGCPAITTAHGALGEIAGEASLVITGRDVIELRNAMKLVHEPAHREALVLKGLQRAALYNWDLAAQRLYELLRDAASELDAPATQSFLSEWKRLRAIQAEVDAAY
jgi:glycosyltransferase involved in cell wall biosynthesis